MRHLIWLLISLSCLTVNADNAVPVSITSPTKSLISETLTLSGSLTAERQAMLSPRVDGLVKKVLVDAGHQVKQGEILLQLDSAIAHQQYIQAKAASAEAEAARNEAKRLVKEAESLRNKNYIAESEIANRLSNLALTEATFMAVLAAEKAALEQLNRHDLPAPFNGVISGKMTEAGEWVNRGKAVLELVATDKVRLDVKVPQERFSAINKNSPVEVIPDVYPERRLSGKISAIVPVSDPLARAFLVRVVVDTSDIKLLPGTSASAIIGLSNDRYEKLLIPRDALLIHPDGGYSVFIVNNGIAERRQITVGQQSENGVSILSGLEVDDQVVVRGNEALRDGQSVMIVDQ